MEHLEAQSYAPQPSPQPQAALPEAIIAHPQAISLYRYVVLGLVGIALLVVAGTLILAALGKPMPESALALGVVAVTGLVGILNSERP